MIVKKFRVLEQAMLVHPDKTKSIVLACCVLHNFIRKQEGKLAEIYVELLTLTADEEPPIPKARASKATYTVRDTYVTFFMSPNDTVDWQEKSAYCT